MNRIFIVAAVAIAALLLMHHPAPPPALVSAGGASARPPAHGRLRPDSGAGSAGEVYVVGAVRRPGIYRVVSGARVNDAVALAGGLVAGADAAGVNLAQRVADGDEIRVPRIGEATPKPARGRGRHRRRARASSNPVPALGTAVDVNAADAATLASLPGVGPTLAARIVEFRDLNGPFASIDELADVAGMTQRRIDAIAPYVTLRSGP